MCKSRRCISRKSRLSGLALSLTSKSCSRRGTGVDRSEVRLVCGASQRLEVHAGGISRRRGRRRRAPISFPSRAHRRGVRLALHRRVGAGPRLRGLPRRRIAGRDPPRIAAGRLREQPACSSRTCRRALSGCSSPSRPGDVAAAKTEIVESVPEQIMRKSMNGRLLEPCRLPAHALVCRTGRGHIPNPSAPIREGRGEV